MKKQGIYALLLVTGIFAAFVVGFFVGRNAARDPLSIELAAVTTISNEADSSSLSPGTIAPALSAATEATASAGLVNINTATLTELTTLPGIGEVLAQRIIDYRDTYGPFSSLNDLTNVEGIGEKRLEAISDYATAGG